MFGFFSPSSFFFFKSIPEMSIQKSHLKKGANKGKLALWPLASLMYVCASCSEPVGPVPFKRWHQQLRCSRVDVNTDVTAAGAN